MEVHEDLSEGLTIVDGELRIVRTDVLASAVLRHVKRQGRRVPGHVSVLSLDDDPAYYHLGLSRCGLDWHGLGHMMAHVFFDGTTAPVTPDGILRARAQIVERRTS